MKNLILPLALMFANVSMAQNDSTPSKYKFGVALSTTYSGMNVRSNPLSILFTVSKGKHQVDFGPQLMLTNLGYYNRRYGLDLTYRYYVKGTENKFNPFLYANVNYFNSMWQNNSNQYKTRYSSNTLSVNLGLGMRYNVTNKIYLSANLGLGYKFFESKWKSTDLNSNSTQSKYDTWKSPNVHGAVTIGFRF